MSMTLGEEWWLLFAQKTANWCICHVRNLWFC